MPKIGEKSYEWKTGFSITLPDRMPRFSPRQLIVAALLAALILGLTLYRTCSPL
jgi:hypothetical protein